MWSKGSKKLRGRQTPDQIDLTPENESKFNVSIGSTWT